MTAASDTDDGLGLGAAIAEGRTTAMEAPIARAKSAQAHGAISRLHADIGLVPRGSGGRFSLRP